MEQKSEDIKSLFNRLEQFSNQGAWGIKKENLFNLIIEDVNNIVAESGLNENVGTDVFTIIKSNKDIANIIHKNFLTSFAAIYWPEQECTLIDDYLETLGKKEGCFELDYLNGLNRSAVDLLFVKSIDKGHITTESMLNNHTQSFELAKSEIDKIDSGDVIAGRVIEIDGNKRLVDGYLMFSDNQYTNIKEAIEDSLEAFILSFGEEYSDNEFSVELRKQIYDQCFADWFLQIWISMLIEKYIVFVEYMDSISENGTHELVNLQFKIIPGARKQIKNLLIKRHKENKSHVFKIDDTTDSLVTLKKSIIEFSVLSKEYINQLEKMVLEEFGEYIEPQPIISYENVRDLMSELTDSE